MAGQYGLDAKPILSELQLHVRITKWYELGVQLQLDDRHLDDIEADGKDSTHKRRKMFQLWLKSKPEATNKELLVALQSKAIEEATIAHNYETFCKTKIKDNPRTVTKLKHWTTCNIGSTITSDIFVILVLIIACIVSSEIIVRIVCILSIIGLVLWFTYKCKYSNEEFTNEPKKLCTDQVPTAVSQIADPKSNTLESIITKTTISEDFKTLQYQARMIVEPLKIAAYRGSIKEVEKRTKECISCGVALHIEVLLQINLGSSYHIVNDPFVFQIQNTALEKAKKLTLQPNCKYVQLLRGQILTFQAQNEWQNGCYEEAEASIIDAKAQYHDTDCYGEIAILRYQEAMVKSAKCYGKIGKKEKQDIEDVLDKALQHAQATPRYQQQYHHCILLSSIAALHLNMFYPFHQYHQENVSKISENVSTDSLAKAKSCLELVSTEYLHNEETTLYKAHYYMMCSDYHRHDNNNEKAKYCLNISRQMSIEGNYNFFFKAIKARHNLLHPREQ